jgi:calmodulin
MDDIEKAFRLFDKDNSGFISKSEMNEFMKRLNSSFCESDLNELIEKLDLSGDGKISLEGLFELIFFNVF